MSRYIDFPAAPTEAACRAYARRCAEQGVALLARALNATANAELPYRFGEQEREAGLRALADLVELIEGGAIELQAVDSARRDRAFQAFLAAQRATGADLAGWAAA